jgi:AraC-like DNA-binding protein
VDVTVSARAPTFISLDGLAEDTAGAHLDAATSEHLQIGSGRLGGEIGFMPLDQATLRRVHFTLDMRLAGKLRLNDVNLAFALRVPNGARISGIAIPPRALVVTDQDAFGDYRFGAGIAWIGIRLLRTDLLDAWSRLTERDLPWANGVLTVTPSGTAAAALTDILAEVERIARQAPALFADAVWRGNAERALRDGYLEALLSGWESANPAVARAGAIVRLIDECIDASDDVIPSVAELCTQIGLGRRMLERACIEILGIGPKHYLRLRALKRVREALLRPASLSQSITSVAMTYGFWHLGRFSVFYRALFGETPSETRRRTRARAGASRVPATPDMTGTDGFPALLSQSG